MALPLPERFFGFAPGLGRLADWQSLTAYFDRLAAASDRLRVLRIGASSEGRPLIAVAASAPRRLAQLTPRPPETPDWATVVRLGGIHAAEGAAAQGSARLLHRLATSPDPEVVRLLEHLLLIVVPAVDPDGLDRMVSWTASGGSGPPPGGCRRWADHDLNRDWMMQTQPEVRAVSAHVLARFGPQVVLDMHEMWADGARMFLPPYAPPPDAHVAPAVLRRAGRLGHAIAARLTASGLAGVATGALFDAYSPARGYPFYHGAVRILCETATVPAGGEVVPRARAGFDPHQASDAQPLPWPGGRWTAADVQRYQGAATWECMRLVATAARHWPRWQAGVLAAAADPDRRPGEWHLAAAQRDRRAMRELLTTLRCGGIETLDGAEGWRVRRAQPHGPWADALLTPTPYPPVEAAPYDVTCHLLPALAGTVTPARIQAEPPDRWPADVPGYGRALRRLAAGLAVWALPPGTNGTPATGAFAAAAPSGVGGAVALRRPQVAIYSGWATGGDDAGWLRYLCARFSVPYRDLRDDELQGAGVPTGVTHVVLPAVRGRELVHGTQAPDWPRAFRGGLGAVGAEALRAFVAEGGHLVALEDAAAWTEVTLALPLRANAAATRQEVSPGSLVAIHTGTATLGLAPGEPTWAMYRGRTVLHADRHHLATFSLSPAPLGWRRGLERLAGTAAVAEVPWRKGRCTLFAFTPYFRAQSWATLPFFFNALLR